MLNRKWAAIIGAVIIYIILLMLFGPGINVILAVGIIAYLTYKFN